MCLPVALGVTIALMLWYIYHTRMRRTDSMVADSPAMMMLKDYGQQLLVYVRKHQANQYTVDAARQQMTRARHNNLKNIDTMDGKMLILLSRYNPATIYEVTRGADGSTSTTYDKGRSMDMCLKDVNGEVHEDNLLKFVFTHELAHIMTYENDHPDVFWMNFKFLLEVAVDNGLYIPYDFASKPVQYCGMMVNHSPLYDQTIPSLFTQYVNVKCGGSYKNCGKNSQILY